MNNKKYSISLLGAVLLFSLVIVPLPGQLPREKPISIPSARTSAIGGTHAALADDFTVLFANPAGFLEVEPVVSVSELTFKLSGPVFDIAGIVLSGEEDLFNSSEVQSMLRGLYTGFNLTGPLSFGYLGDGLGFGMFSNSNLEFRNDKPLQVTARLTEEVSLLGGYAFRLPLPERSVHKLDLGILMKGGIRGEVEITKSFLQLEELLSSLAPGGLVHNPFDLVSIIGFDLGIRYEYNDVLAVGLVGRDIFSPTLRSKYTTLQSFLDGGEIPSQENGLVPLDLSLGIMYRPPIGGEDQFLSGMKVFLDYRDIIDFWTHPKTAKNPLLHIGLGTELEFLKVLSFRLGFNEGYLTAGLGLDLSVLALNASMFGSELSSEPGMRPVYNLMIGLEFRY